MKEFIAENWQFFISLCLSILLILVSLIRKNKLINEVLDTPFERVMSLLPGLIGEAESSFIGADKKKLYVLSSALGLLEKFEDRKLSIEEISKYTDRISVAIESILETPQKKGVNYDKKEKN